MNVTLTQVAQVAPDAAVRIREAIRDRRIQAERQTGVAGRPYMIRTEDLIKIDHSWASLVRQLESAEPTAMTDGGRPRERRVMTRMAESPGEDSALVGRMLLMMEGQAAMMRSLVDAVMRDAHRREDRVERMQQELEQLSYKLGQAHQEIGRLERHVAERQIRMSRAEEA